MLGTAIYSADICWAPDSVPGTEALVLNKVHFLHFKGSVANGVDVTVNYLRKDYGKMGRAWGFGGQHILNLRFTTSELYSLLTFLWFGNFICKMGILFSLQAFFMD